MTRPDPTEGLNKAERLALFDAHRGMLGRFEVGWQRQTSAHFQHSDATIEKLVARGLLMKLPGEIAATTHRGRALANRLRARAETVRQYELGKAMSAGVVRALGERRACRIQ